MAAISTGSSIFARARTISTQTMTDANVSQVVDNLGGLRSLLNHTVRQVYRNKAKDQKFFHDITTRNTVAVVSGVGACPDVIMREFLHLSEFQDDVNSLITYYDYAVDADSGQNFRQLGYVWLQGDTFHYTAPNQDAGDFTGDLYVNAPCFPTFPASMSSNITFPSVAVIDDIVLSLAAAIVGHLDWANSIAVPVVKKR